MMPQGLIKVCGLTSVQQTLQVVEAGVGAVGFNVWPRSVRSVSWELAAQMMQAVRGHVLGVVVMVDASLEEVQAVFEVINPDYVQLHGHETAHTVQKAGSKCYKAVGLAGQEDVDVALHMPGEVVLVDAKNEVLRGGTGTQAPADCVAQVVARRRTLLAGGLGVHNVAWAVEHFSPWGVDAASLLESAPGQKDIPLVKTFVQEASCAFQKVQHV
jgi:phosphoribosylanthranilate isomerase